MEWIEVKIRKISELKTKEERNFMVTELRNELKYYKDTTNKKLGGGSFSPWAIHYYPIAPYLINILKNQNKDE